MAQIGIPKNGRAAAGAGLVILLLLNIGLALIALHAVITGKPDSYHNQQMRLLANSLSGVFIVSALITQWRTRYTRVSPANGVFLILAICTVVWSLSLAR
jgi:hypothetical protein